MRNVLPKKKKKYEKVSHTNKKCRLFGVKFILISRQSIANSIGRPSAHIRRKQIDIKIFSISIETD